MIALVDLSFVLVYFVVVIIIGLLAARKQSEEDFLIAERKLGEWQIAASVSAGFMGGGFLVAYASYVFEFGMAALWIFIGVVLGFLLLLFYHKKLKELADKEKFYTISDYFKFKYGKSPGIMSAVAVIFYFMFFLIVEFIAGGRILSSLLGFSYSFSIFLMAVVVLFYLGFGGFKSVIKTDLFQYLVLILFTIIIGIFLVAGTSIPSQEFSLVSAGIGNAFAFVLLGAFATFMAPDLWQRLYAAKNVLAAKKSLWISSLFVFVFGFVIALIGIVAKVNFPDILPGEALVYGLSHLLPVGLLGLGLVMLFAAIMSSVDTSLFILGMNVSEDITLHYRNLTKKQLISLTRWAIIGFTIVSLAVAIFIQSIISVALAFGSVSFVLIPALIGSFHFKLKPKAVFWSILIGLISVLVILFAGYITPESSLVSLPVSLIALILGQIFLKKIKH